MKMSKTDRTQQIQELHSRIDENTLAESTSKKAFEDEIQNSLNSVLASEDSRRVEFQLTYDEEQQNVAVCITSFIVLLFIIYIFLALIFFL